MLTPPPKCTLSHIPALHDTTTFAAVGSFIDLASYVSGGQGKTKTAFADLASEIGESGFCAALQPGMSKQQRAADGSTATTNHPSSTRPLHPSSHHLSSTNHPSSQPTRARPGRDVYMDVAGWHLYLRDVTAVPGVKMDAALAQVRHGVGWGVW